MMNTKKVIRRVEKGRNEESEGERKRKKEKGEG